MGSHQKRGEAGRILLKARCCRSDDDDDVMARTADVWRASLFFELALGPVRRLQLEASVLPVGPTAPRLAWNIKSRAEQDTCCQRQGDTFLLHKLAA